MPLSCGLNMFFDEKLLLIALFFVESHVLCRLCPLWSLSIVVLSFPGTQQSELFNRTQCRQCYDKTPLQLPLEEYLQSRYVGCCFPG